MIVAAIVVSFAVLWVIATAIFSGYRPKRLGDALVGLLCALLGVSAFIAAGIIS